MMSGCDLQKGFRIAMRSLHATVSVVTTAVAGQRYNITVTSVTSLSMEPPSLLICINRTAEIYPGLREASHFCINILSREQVSIAANCATHLLGEERFALGNWRTGAQSLPILEGACVSLCCHIDLRQRYGSHDIIVGCVEVVIPGAGGEEPLRYGDGEYLNADRNEA